MIVGVNNQDWLIPEIIVEFRAGLQAAGGGIVNGCHRTLQFIPEGDGNITVFIDRFFPVMKSQTLMLKIEELSSIGMVINQIG